ncbi:MAG: NADH-quinone oxidoreductase subunit NuoG [Holosporales bacterium]
MIKLTINGQEIEVPEGTTILQAAQMLGAEVPVFCYHPRLPVAGNCRMCLVQMEGSPKPVASCAMPAGNNMVIHTNTEYVEKARKGVLEFLLINHPLDCPICDQGGECDLQDITMAYGPSSSRFAENKRAVPDKYMGPLIKTSMTRCIHCTRCIRFATDIAGVSELGAIGRGEDMEVTSYLDQAVTSELSANVIDLCPVGALTSAPYAFQGRPWDLTKTESIDVLDAVGSNIRVDTYGLKVVRILPRLHEDINEEWLSDKSRFACDGLSRQRLDRPYVRQNGALVEASWQHALEAVAAKVRQSRPERMGALAGNLADVESMVALKDLLTRLEVTSMDCRLDGAKLDASVRASYLFNTTIAGIERSDFCLIVNSNVRLEAPLIMARLRKRYLQGGFAAAYVGGALPEDKDLTIPYENLGADPALLEATLAGRNPLAKLFKAAAHPMLIIGQEALTRPDGAQILRLGREIAEKFNIVRDDWNGFNVLHKAAARVGGLDAGFIPGAKGLDLEGMLKASKGRALDVLFLLGADDFEIKKLEPETFVVYIGHHGDAGAQRADVILPSAAYTEKSATYVNTEGRVQRTMKALNAPGEAKEDWRIIRALSEVLAQTLPYDTVDALRARMAQLNPVFAHHDQISMAPWQNFGVEGALLGQPFAAPSPGFYMTDSISRHSETMAACIHAQDPSAKEGRRAIYG